MFGDNQLNLVQKQKYLGIFLDDHLNFENCATVLSESAGRALGGVIHKFKSLKDVGLNTFNKIYESSHTSEIWGYQDVQCCANIKLGNVLLSKGTQSCTYSGYARRSRLVVS